MINKNDRQSKPLIHCITNPISINQCANTVLAVGAQPIMAEHPKEVCDITRASDALMLNIGNITDARMEAMPISLKEAERKNIPVVLDVVGLACSSLRKDFISKLMKVAIPTVIKGNYSEIFALYDKGYRSLGVDADASLDVCHVTKAAKQLALKYKTVILATGQTDIITDGEKTVCVKNGTPELASVTGTGCMLGALCATFLTSLAPMEGAVASCVYLGICGEMAKTEKGNGSFMINLMDKIATLNKEEILRHRKLEEI